MMDKKSLGVLAAAGTAGGVLLHQALKTEASTTNGEDGTDDGTNGDTGGEEINLSRYDREFTTPSNVDTTVTVFETLNQFTPDKINYADNEDGPLVYWIDNEGYANQVRSGDTWKPETTYKPSVMEDITFTLPTVLSAGDILSAEVSAEEYPAPPYEDGKHILGYFQKWEKADPGYYPGKKELVKTVISLSPKFTDTEAYFFYDWIATGKWEIEYVYMTNSKIVLESKGSPLDESANGLEAHLKEEWSATDTVPSVEMSLGVTDMGKVQSTAGIGLSTVGATIAGYVLLK